MQIHKQGVANTKTWHLRNFWGLFRGAPQVDDLPHRPVVGLKCSCLKNQVTRQTKWREKWVDGGLVCFGPTLLLFAFGFWSVSRDSNFILHVSCSRLASQPPLILVFLFFRLFCLRLPTSNVRKRKRLLWVKACVYVWLWPRVWAINVCLVPIFLFPFYANCLCVRVCLCVVRIWIGIARNPIEMFAVHVRWVQSRLPGLSSTSEFSHIVNSLAGCMFGCLDGQSGSLSNSLSVAFWYSFEWKSIRSDGPIATNPHFSLYIWLTF